MAIGIAQFTIKDLNDITTSSTAPSSPTIGRLWLDTSVTPNLLKKWNGSTWGIVNETIVGGRNLILNGDFSKGTVVGSSTAPTNWNFFGSRTVIYSNQGKTGYNLARTLYIGHDTVDSGIQQSLSLSKSTQYTISFSSGKESVNSVYSNITYYDSSNNILSTSAFSHTLNEAVQSFTFTTPSTFDHCTFIHGGIATTYGSGYLTRLGNIKIEKGNKATDWTPAPEDVDAIITAVKTVTETNTTSINTIQGQISTLISNTTITKDGTTTQLKDAYNSTVATVSSILTTIGEHTTDIDANTTNITSVTAKAATLEANLNSISATLTSTQSTVSTHTTQITTVTNTANSAKSTLDTKSPTWDAKASTSYVDGKASEAETNAKNYAKTGNLYLRGTGLNRSASRILKINDSQMYNENSSRGLRLVTINRSTLAVVENIIYDVYGSDTAKTNLADKLNSLDDSVIVTLTSYYAIATNDSLDDAIQRVGGTGTRFGGSFHRVPFALVGIAGIGKGNGIEIFTGLDTTAPMAEIYTKIVDGVPQGINSASTVLANNASATAMTANTNASTALTTANTANSTATTASSNASTAVTTANSAVSTANTASTKASNAVSTANTASTNASSALTAANTATANVATLTTSVTSVTSRVTAVELTASGLTTRVEVTESTLENLEIGGRNLLIGMKNSTFTIAGDGTGTGEKVIITNYYANLEAGNTYTFSCKTDGTWRNGAGSDTVEAFLLKDKGYTKYYVMTTNPTTFTCNTTGTYYLRFDINKSNVTHTFWNVKVEKGNIATDWTPAPEDIDSSIADVKTYAATTINSNVSTINQTTNAITANVTALQSNVSTIETTLGNKADTTTVTAISNRTATLETSVTGINASITTLNSNVSSVTTTANSAKSAIDGLQVGGRNLILGSGFSDFTNWTKGTNWVVSAGTYQKNNVMECDRTSLTVSTSSYSDLTQIILYEKLELNVPYTISFYIKCTANSTTPFKWYLTNITGISSDNGWIPISDTSDWVKVSKTITFTVKQNSNNPVIFFRTFDGNKVSITKPKFEKGNQATDWTPAQEDVDQAITSVQTYATTNITSLTSSVSVLQSQIALKVEQTQINTAVATLNGQITATNASITSLQSSINLQLDSITNTVSQAVSIKNLINNAAFNNTLGDYNAQNTVTMCRIVKSSEYTGWGGYVKPPVSDNVLAIRYDMTGDNYIEFKNLFAKVKPSTTYTISYYYTMNGEYAGPSSFIYERTAAQWNVVGYTTATIIGPDAITARSTWVRYTKTFTTQSTTDSIMLRFGFHQTHSSSFCEMLITGVQLELGSSATAWVDSTISQVGTSIIQSTTEVMTAFNGISSYFKVNADGATFGDVASGDYTTVGSGGMKHHIGSTNSDYKYITYVGEVSITINGSTYKDVTISYPADLVALLNGKVPVGIASIKIATWSDVPVHYIGCTITNITSTSCTIRGYNVSTSSSVIISYILVA